MGRRRGGGVGDWEGGGCQRGRREKDENGEGEEDGLWPVWVDEGERVRGVDRGGNGGMRSGSGAPRMVRGDGGVHGQVGAFHAFPLRLPNECS